MDKEIINEVKHWLHGAEYCQRAIQANLDEIERLRTLAERVTTSYSDCHAGDSRRRDRVGDTTAKIVDYEQKLQNRIQELINHKEHIQFVITNFVDDYNQRIVMEYRYVHLYKWEEVAEKTHYSWAGVFKVHDKALKRLAEQYPFEPKQKREENQDANIQTL